MFEKNVWDIGGNNGDINARLFINCWNRDSECIT